MTNHNKWKEENIGHLRLASGQHRRHSLPKTGQDKKGKKKSKENQWRKASRAMMTVGLNRKRNFFTPKWFKCTPSSLKSSLACQ